ncbi:hypothetical protein ACA910_013800 [Epithemia clementina (nom. ined.)]
MMMSSTSMVHALCSVTDENGQVMSLDPKNNKKNQKEGTTGVSLPSGVTYHADADRLECRGLHSCQGWTMDDCFQLDCLGTRACQATKLTRLTNVQCRGKASCQASLMQDVRTVVCTGGTDSLKSCHAATLQTNLQVTCLGPQACVGDGDGSGEEDTGSTSLGRPGVVSTLPKDPAAAPKQTDEQPKPEDDNDNNDGPDVSSSPWRTVLQLGASGVVKCTGGQGKRSCQNLTIYINHARRACFRDPFLIDSNHQQNSNPKSFVKDRSSSSSSSSTGEDEKSSSQPLQREHCAVICDNAETECDFESIHFVVMT